MDTTIYLDVDGVLNAVSPVTPKMSGWASWERIEVADWPIQYSSEMVSAINEISEMPGVEIKWLTTWCWDARTLICPALNIDGESWEVVGWDQYRLARQGKLFGWWKLQALKDTWDDKTALVWIDDDLDLFAGDVREFIQNKVTWSLTERPETHVGLTLYKLNSIRQFIKTVEGKNVGSSY